MDDPVGVILVLQHLVAALSGFPADAGCIVEDFLPRGVVLDFSRPGKPMDNAFIEAFNGRFRAECLNQALVPDTCGRGRKVGGLA